MIPSTSISAVESRSPLPKASAISLVEWISGALLVAALLLIQILIGGTRLLFSFPAYGLLGLMGLLSVASLRRIKPEPDRFCLWASAIFFGYILLRAFLSPVPYLARPDIFSVLGGLMVYLFVALVFTAPRGRSIVVLCLLAFSIAHVFVGAIQFRDGNNFMPFSFLQRSDYGPRASGFYVCPNHLAGLLEVLGALGLSIICWSRWPIWAKMLTAYAAVIALAGIVLTGSRGGYLSTLASLAVLVGLSLLILQKSGGKMIFKVGIPALIVGLAIFAVAIFAVRHSNFLTGRAQAVADTSNVRIQLWKSAVAEWKLSPIWGTGSGTFLLFGRKFRPSGLQSDPIFVHNDYLHLLCEYGATGATLFLLFFLAHARRGWLTFKRLGLRRAAVSPILLSNGLALNLGALAAVAAYVVHSVFDFNLHIPANVLVLAFVFGLLANPGLDQDSTGSTMLRGTRVWRLSLALIAVIVGVACVRLLPAEYFCERARTSIRDDRPIDAIKFAQKGLATEGHNPDLFYYLGRARVDQADGISNQRARISFLTAAIQPFQRGLALSPNDGSFQIALAKTFDQLGRFSEAEWMFDEAIEWDPQWQWLREQYKVHLAEWGAEVPAAN